MATGFINGSDLLLFVGEKAVGHCTTHTITYSAETKDRAFKPLASADPDAGKWKETAIVGLSYEVKVEGLMFDNETEYGYQELLTAWAAGEAVTIKACRRKSDTKPYLSGKCVITSLEESGAANEDGTYSATFKNSGKPEIAPAEFYSAVAA